MRRFMFLICLLALVQLSFAQQATTLALSKCPLTIKITDPQRQLKTFAPILSRFDEIGHMLQPNDAAPSVKLSSGITMISRVPGVNATGDFWLAITAQPDAVAPKADANQQGGNAAKGNPAQAVPAFLLVPLQDAAKFQQAIAVARGMNQTLPPLQIFPNYAVVKVNGPDTPKFTGLDLDVHLISTQDIVICGQVAAMQFPPAAAEVAPMAAMFGPIVNIFNSVQQNQQRVELGFAMKGDDLALDALFIPVPGSSLAKSIEKAELTPLPTNLAGLLPDNLAYCSASGPMWDGMPGLGSLGTQYIAGMFSAMAPDDQRQAFQTQLTNMVSLCSKGRAIGITAPAAGGGATIVAVYQTENVNDTSALLLNFIGQTMQIRDAIFGGALTNVLKIEHKPAAEKIAGVQADILNITLDTSGGRAQQGGQAANKPIPIACRIAYMGDKMFFTAGEGCREQMADMISRAKTNTPAFTQGKRFATMKTLLPENVHGFESFATLDLCRAMVSLFPLSPDQKQNAMAFFDVLPSHRSTISGYQDCRQGCIHDEIYVPAEQTDFLFFLLKSAVQEQLNRAKAAQKPAPAQ